MSAAVQYEARRYCKGDAGWTEWQPVTGKYRDDRKTDPSFEFREVQTPAPTGDNKE